MQSLINIQNAAGIEKDDPHHAAIISVYAHLA